MPVQAAWRFCNKCKAMYFDGFEFNKGVCAQGGGVHVAAGFNFVLPHDVPETPTAQARWRFCQKCNAMFFNDFDEKRFCAKDHGAIDGRGHVAAGFNFVLPHDVPETPTAQARWRFCQKCLVMFFEGSGPPHGVCAQDGHGHVAAGFNFVLPHIDEQ